MRLPDTIALLVCIATIGAVSAAPSVRTTRLPPVPAHAQLRVSGARSLQPQSLTAAKLDSALADLLGHYTQARPGHFVEDLRAMNPAAHFVQRSTDSQPLVLIDAITRGDPRKLQAALVQLGLQQPAMFSNDVSGWLPINQIQAAAARTELHAMRAAMSRTRVGAVTSQGDFVQRSDVVRTTNSTLTGAGVTVGVISDSFDCYSAYAKSGLAASGASGYASNGFLATAATDMSTGDLPGIVDVVQEASCMNYGGPSQLPFGDEGRAMMQVVHDVAPGAALAFYTAENGEAGFASGIGKLAQAGAKVIADDVGYFDEPFYQDGLIAQAVDAAQSQGVAYFSAAGNNGNNSYETTTPDFSTPSPGAPNPNEFLLNFAAPGANSTVLPVSIPSLSPGEFIAVVLQWDQPYVTGSAGSPGASNHLDLCLTSSGGTDTITNLNGQSVSCTGANATGADPVQILVISNPGTAKSNTAAQTVDVMVGLADGTIAPNRVKVVIEDGGAGAAISQYATNSSTLQGHPGAAGAAAVGAAFFFDTPMCGTSPAVIETYSGVGGTPILFDTSGNRLATAVVRVKPDFVGPDGVNDTFLGFTLASAGLTGGQLPTTIAQCQNDPNYPNFFGTSAATPHAAAIAALMLQANSALTPSQIYQALRTSASTMGSSTPNTASGYGFLQADAALALLPPGIPSLSLSTSSVTAGGSATLTWSSINTSGCTASGSWSGTLKTSGSQVITAPATAGTATYTLNCTNAAGTGTNSAKLAVMAAGSGGGGASSGGGGGGDLDALTLLVLGAMGLASLAPRLRAKRI